MQVLETNGAVLTRQRSVDEFMDYVAVRNPHEPEFLQAVREVVETVMPFLASNPHYDEEAIMNRLVEPDRVIMFRVTWEDDYGVVQVNRGYRVQFNGALGPYKGGLRFHPSVNLSILKFLGFEQVLKNSLTTLPMGGAKGGADFNPKGKSDAEVMRFCHSFMTELFRHIGPDTDVPAGDIGVGSREVGFMFGQYRRLSNKFTGTMTGKGRAYGGSLIRPEATGYGNVYFAEQMLAHADRSLEGMTCVVSGSGNVAQFTIEKLIEKGAKVVGLSDSSGTVFDRDGMDSNKLAYVMHLKNDLRGRISEYAEEFGCEYLEGKNPWSIPCDAAFPSATQNEISAADARALIAGGCTLVSEGANMPSTAEASRILREAGVLFGPGKAANAGGVAISGIEMTQNSMRMSWTREQVDARLQEIMRDIHSTCVAFGTSDNGRCVDYVKGANVGGFVKVAEAMLAYGVT